MQNKKP
jgi:hypothetical protein